MYTFKSRVLQTGFQQFRFELYTRLCFETEVKGNLEMAYLCVFMLNALAMHILNVIIIPFVNSFMCHKTLAFHGD